MSTSLYVAKQRAGYYIKIGISTDVPRRLSFLGVDLIALFVPDDGDARPWEKKIHADLADDRAPFGREWFEPTGYVEKYLGEFFGTPVDIWVNDWASFDE